MRPLRKITLAALSGLGLAVLAACSPIIQQEGNVPDPDQVKPGQPLPAIRELNIQYTASYRFENLKNLGAIRVTYLNRASRSGRHSICRRVWGAMSSPASPWRRQRHLASRP